jgi:hypothetical protein
MSSGVASAGTKLSLGIGSVRDLGNDFDAIFESEGYSSAKLAVGYRFGQFTIEGSLFGSEVQAKAEWKTTSLGAEVKYNIPIISRLEGVVHGGLHKTWFGKDRGASTHDGKGTLLGLGLEYGFALKPLASASVWLDYTRQGMKLDGEGFDVDGSIGVLLLGVSVGL